MDNSLSFDFDEMDIFIINESLKSLLDDLEYERKQMASTKEIIESGIVNEIRLCENAMKSIKMSKDFNESELIAVCLALISFIDILEENISNMETSIEKNDILDLRRDVKKILRKLKPFYDSLNIDEDI